MKKFLLSSLFAVALVGVAWSVPQTRTTFYSQGQLTFQVFVDGSLVNQRPRREVNLDWLSPGRHRVRVEAYHRRGGYQVFTGNIRVRGDHHSHYLVNGNRRLGLIVNLDHEVPLADFGYVDDFHDGSHYGSCSGNCGGACWILSRREVRDIKQRMLRQGFDEDKLRVAKRALRNQRNMYAEDVARLMNAFSFERFKVELAKFAYERTVDPENYHVVYAALTFSSSQCELDQFLGYNEGYYRDYGRRGQYGRRGRRRSARVYRGTRY